MAKVTLMTQAQYAEHRGVSRVAVHKAIKDERISTIDGKIDPAVADIQWAANSRARAPSSPAAAALSGARPDAASRPAASAPDPGDPGYGGMFESPDDYGVSRARREAAEAELAELVVPEGCHSAPVVRRKREKSVAGHDTSSDSGKSTR